MILRGPKAAELSRQALMRNERRVPIHVARANACSKVVSGGVYRDARIFFVCFLCVGRALTPESFVEISRQLT